MGTDSKVRLNQISKVERDNIYLMIIPNIKDHFRIVFFMEKASLQFKIANFRDIGIKVNQISVLNGL